MIGIQGLITPLGKAWADEQHNAPIVFRADDTAGGLHDPIKTGIGVGISKSILPQRVMIGSQYVSLHVELRQPYADDRGAGKTVAYQVNALGKKDRP